jgi:hypothetical protein
MELDNKKSPVSEKIRRLTKNLSDQTHWMSVNDSIQRLKESRYQTKYLSKLTSL